MAETEATKTKVTLHWLDKSRSQRFVWLLQECKGIELKIEVYKRMSNMLAPPELKEIHPLGKSPVIAVEAPNAAKPLVLAESGFMSEYLTDYFAQHLVPKRYQEGKENQVGGETEQWLRYRYYMHYAEGSLMTILLLGLFIDQIKNAPVPFFIKPITRQIAARVESAFLTENFATHFGFLESQIASSPDGGKYLCGKELTAADILMSFPLLAARASDKIDKATYPKLMGYIDTLEAEEGYKKSVAKIEEVTGEKYTTRL
ncbi:Glutathione S-transferase 1 [Lecanosticta acicola]|uniref:Glutathione S-transferase 1 n=1 Tax=Lecanosticta acicola TaxID=111012 RepID=A0AAI8Z0K4_9PEZI|nr:Glutathione S-transferase 1 [Lecanosticta acicola]